MPEQLAPTQTSLTNDLINDCNPPAILDDTLERPDLFSDAVGQQEQGQGVEKAQEPISLLSYLPTPHQILLLTAKEDLHSK
jgi:hypothetical protein